MRDQDTNTQYPASLYRVQVRGEIGPRWQPWFDDLTLTLGDTGDGPVTTLTGSIVDQAGLRGLLNKLWDLNLTLLSVTRLEESSENSPHSHPVSRSGSVK